ncbi:MAG: 5-formyltetrahydrofolate cyclo-ligase [Desulfobulbaceae bacterium]|jgi:5-formyltetrahydrofolate cyclo-ligase|nr:5-formyltetrahydrofolate cyclo-ligase [Desulfobulbaceae bacterium]HKJ14737.1 5-formyltetrahydrofolate cyclo-ligase [Desulfobulbales bacterium]MDH3541620.1 5-formyltetrahydrofolate cyclo-ligase [Desulfobulbaceae bacterium]MDH3775520.1 5-formyltetrahydrofolate cyclo-ligase [Desulfobulbaceae bacterium]MDH3781319.1 5-formyltetrahydrofolate cyclo-ligase [Desulfobulbaceae bacterium]
MKEDREALRQKILGARDGLSDKVRQAKSISVMQNFWTLLGMQQWSTLFIYVNFRSEVETLELIKKCINRDIRVAVPLVEASAVRMIPLLIKDPEQDLVPGYYNIPEPDPKKSLRLEPGEIDAAVIPGSVFDIHGGRLGYGGGYYDRFLLNDAPQAKRIGLAFELQVVDNVPLEPHDQPLDILITEERIVNITR